MALSCWALINTRLLMREILRMMIQAPTILKCTGNRRKRAARFLDLVKPKRKRRKKKLILQNWRPVPTRVKPFEIGNVDEDDKPSTNYVLLYNILNDISRKRIDLGINIPAGNTIYQILDDNDYKEVKENQIVEIVEEKLKAIYGDDKSSDFYSYEVREDGSLILASVDDSPRMLHIVEEAREFYRGQLKIKEIYPDEVALLGLLKKNYDLDANEVTALIQFEKKNCRIIFLKGNEVYLIPPPIGEGTRSSDFLNVVFSKILFQLDSGEVPELNRIIIANNSIGDRALDFFRENLSSLQVEDFQYDEAFLDQGTFDDNTLKPFTTAIALGAAAAQKDEGYPKLSMIPGYVEERQKIFKIEWHGIMLLVLIFLTFPVANYFYQQNANEIESLSTELERTTQQIEQLQPIVQQTNEISQNLSLLTAKLSLLDSLSTGSRTWSHQNGYRKSGNEPDSE